MLDLEPAYPEEMVMLAVCPKIKSKSKRFSLSIINQNMN